MADYTYDVATYDVGVYAPAGTVLVELLVNGVWTDITLYVRVADGIRIRRGRQDWSQAPSFTTCELTLDNRDGRFSPRNSSGAYYPYLVRNTQLRVSVYLDDGTSTVRFWGDVAEWPVSWDYSGNEITTTVVACGLRRQLSSGAVSLESPYKRAMKRLTDVVQYWPLEDGSAATSFGSALPGLASAYPSTSGVTFSSDDVEFAAASDALPVLSGDGAAIRGTVPRYTPTGSPTATVVRCLLSCASSTANAGVDIVVQMSTGNYYVFEYIPQSATGTLNMYDPAGTLLGTNGPWAVWASGVGVRLSLEFTTNGTGVDMGFAQYVVGATSGSATTVTTVASQSLGYVTAVTVRNGSSPSGSTDITTVIGHLSVENAKPSLFDILYPTTGNAGESALSRVSRLCTEQGVALVSVGAFATLGKTSELQGPQDQLTFLDLVDQAMYVDGGVSSEDVPTRALYCASTGALYSHDPSDLVLSYGSQRFNGLQAVDDDQTTANDVTVSRTNGASARYQVTSGNLSVSTIGDYAQTFDLNLYTDDQALPQAQWRAVVGTQDYPRWSQIAFDARNALTSAQRTSLAAVREGYVVALTGMPAYSGAASSFEYVQVLGWTETITDWSWQFDMHGIPATPWRDVLILDSATKGKLDTGRLAL